jgi:hypothetical protein
VILCDTGPLVAAALSNDDPDLVDEYADLPLGSTEAAVIALAERLAVRETATLDRRRLHRRSAAPYAGPAPAAVAHA